MGWSMEIKGAREIDKALTAMGRKDAKKLFRGALRDGAKTTVLPRAKMNALTMVGGTMGGLMARYLQVKSAKSRGGTLGVNVQFRKGSDIHFVSYTKGSHEQAREVKDRHGKTRTKWKLIGKRYYIPAAIEFGHGSRKDQAAIPFMRSAWMATQRQALATCIRLLWGGVKKVATRGKAA